ncbi:hypothetical protein As57867_002089, partial [Aphanomyces stellatus]
MTWLSRLFAPPPRMKTQEYMDEAARHRRKSTLRLGVTAAGFIYIMGSVSSSSGYLTLVQPHLANDLWWPDLNATGTQTFLADIVHTRMNLHPANDSTLAFPLATAVHTLTKDYSGKDTLVTLPAASPRQALLGNLALTEAIASIRLVSLATAFAYPVAYCWVDLARTFEMAHTAARQTRCAATDMDNAAVYLEAILRSYNATSIRTWDAFGVLDQTVLTQVVLVDSTRGSAWTNELLSPHRQLAPMADEVAYWTRHGATRFTFQLQNSYAQVLDDAIVVEDALGIQTMFTINSVAASSRGVVPGTTFWASYSLVSVMTQATPFNCSLVRGSPNDASALGLSWDTDIFFAGTQGFPGLDLLRANVGPLGSMDIRMIAVPPALATYFLSFRQVLYDYIQQDSNMQQTHAGLLEPVVDPAPAAWSNSTYLFFGGSPLCPMQ